MRALVIVFLILNFTNLLFSQEIKVIPIGEKVVSSYKVDIILNKVEVSPAKIICYFFFKNKSSGFGTEVGLKGAYIDNYESVIIRTITPGMNYTLCATCEKSFIIEINRPAVGLYLTGINLGGDYRNGSIKLSKDFIGYASVDVSSALGGIRAGEILERFRARKKREKELAQHKKVTAYALPILPKDTKIPTITLSSPAVTQGIYRTAEFSAIISGKATDEEGIAFVTVNEQNASLKSDGWFQKRMKLKIGKNPVKILAIDINDNVAELAINIIREEIIEDEEFSDVDFALETGNKNRNGIAVVFGIEDYQYAPSVSYAYNDADIFREYLIKTFGYSRENIYFRTNERATKGEFDKAFSENGWIAKNATRKSDVIIFYAGHGSPELKEGQSYLVPYDIDPNYATTGYALDELYQNLGKLKVNSITVILDACFSGGTRDNQQLLADARPVYISFEGSAVLKNTVVFSAASGKEISSAYKQKLHGLFTYFFLKGLNGDADENKDKKITVIEMHGYLEDNVPQQARKMGREQTPQLTGKDSKRVLLKY